jgi:hypothetical protein
MRNLNVVSFLAVAALASSAFAQTQDFTVSGLTQDFNSMGTSGTVAPTGWKHFIANFGNNNTWGSSIPAAGANSVASVAVSTAGTTLTATTTPNSTNNNGFNAARSTGNTADRAIAASPTTVAGAIIQLAAKNAAGSSFASGASLSLSFDTIRYTSVSSANQLPGYSVFLSLNGTSWTQVGSTPTITDVPNTVGITARTINFVLPAAWSANSTAYFRWVDDNALQTSPDQIVGLDNVNLVPAPGAVALMGMGMIVGGRRRR